MDRVQYRLANISDLEAITLAGTNVFDFEVKPNRTAEFFADPNSFLVIAVHNDEVVGIASGLVYVHPDKDPSLFINEVSVVDHLQRRGIGRNLVTFALDEGRRRGCREAWLGTEESNLPAIQCYKAADGSVDDEKFVLFTWKLD